MPYPIKNLGSHKASLTKKITKDIREISNDADEASVFQEFRTKNVESGRRTNKKYLFGTVHNMHALYNLFSIYFSVSSLYLRYFTNY